LTRLSRFCEALTMEMLDAYEGATGVTCAGVTRPPARARAVAEARIRELAREIDGDTQGPAQTYLEEPADPNHEP
jgi:hypothetical protein